MKDNEKFWRLFIYVMGMIVLSIGITLNTKSHLGVSAIISIPFSIAEIFGLNFGAVTFAVYFVFVVMQFMLKGKNREYKDLLQIPFSVLFSVLLDFFGKVITIDYNILWQNLIVLFMAIVITAIGISMTVTMKLIPNPADGLAQAIGDFFKKDMGFGKNLLDIGCVITTVAVSLIFDGRITAIGLGTIIAMIAVGRVVYLFNYVCKNKMQELAGV